MGKGRVILRSQISERIVETSIARYFGWVTPEENAAPFDLVPANEAMTGADHQFQSGILLYLQYKKANGLTPGHAKLTGAGPATRIRHFRQVQGLSDTPHSLYFPLRKKAKTAIDFQHNILLQHDAWPNSRAMYVAPLHLTKQAYDRAFFGGAKNLLHPFDYWHWQVTLRDSRRKAPHIFAAVPFLREHVSIVPHRKVKSANHYYSFGVGGGDVAFHSEGEKVPEENANLLSESLAVIADRVLKRRGLSAEQMSRFVAKLADRGGFKLEAERDNLKRVSMYGKWLKENFGVHQYIFTTSERGP
jgi:hypothetical protein